MVSKLHLYVFYVQKWLAIIEHLFLIYCKFIPLNIFIEPLAPFQIHSHIFDNP